MKCAILSLACILALAGCGLLAEVGVLDESYKGSFIRGDWYADACESLGGEWSWKPGTKPHCDISDLF